TAGAELMGPALGDTKVRVGTGGFVILTITVLESDGFALGVLTVTLAVPVVVRSAAGTVANSSVTLLKWISVATRAVPFHCTTEVAVKPVPSTVMSVLGEPTRIE